MRLVSISVEDYRSIARASKIRLGHSTILVGPNNEGKSNILRALVTGMNVLTAQRKPLHFPSDPRPHRFLTRQVYSWEKDYPIHLQSKKPNGESLITLEFELDAEELIDFQTEIQSSLNGTLPIRIALGPKPSSRSRRRIT